MVCGDLKSCASSAVRKNPSVKVPDGTRKFNLLWKKLYATLWAEFRKFVVIYFSIKCCCSVITCKISFGWVDLERKRRYKRFNFIFTASLVGECRSYYLKTHMRLNCALTSMCASKRARFLSKTSTSESTYATASAMSHHIMSTLWAGFCYKAINHSTTSSQLPTWDMCWDTKL